MKPFVVSKCLKVLIDLVAVRDIAGSAFLKLSRSVEYIHQLNIPYFG